jgi:hypothetical protein
MLNSEVSEVDDFKAPQLTIAVQNAKGWRAATILCQFFANLINELALLRLLERVLTD